MLDFDNSHSPQLVVICAGDRAVRQRLAKLIAGLGASAIAVDSVSSAADILASLQSVALLYTDEHVSNDGDGIGLASEAVARWPNLATIISLSGTRDADLPDTVVRLHTLHSEHQFCDAVRDCLKHRRQSAP